MTAHEGNSSEEIYHELAFYTLSHSDPSFIHQHLVDVYSAQIANEETKPIKVIFALVGLYLYLEKGFTGKEVQNFHVKMSQDKKPWPKINLPEHRGKISPLDVLAITPGVLRDAGLREWCEDVWKSYWDNHPTIRDLVSSY